MKTKIHLGIQYATRELPEEAILNTGLFNQSGGSIGTGYFTKSFVGNVTSGKEG